MDKLDKLDNWKHLLLKSREYINRQTLHSFRVLILSHLDQFYSLLTPLEQELLIDDAFIPLDVKDLISLLKLLLKFKEIYFLKVLLEFYSIDWIVKSMENVEKDWENWISLIFKVPVAFCLDSNDYFKDLFYKVVRVIKDREVLANRGIELDKILAKATRSNQLIGLFQVLQDEAGITDLILKLSLYEHEMFLFQYLMYLVDKNEDFEVSSRKFAKIAGISESGDNSLKMTIKSRFFTNRIQDYGKMHLLIHSIAGNQGFLLDCAKYLIRNWGNSNLISSNAIQSCRHYSCFLLLTINHLQLEYLKELKLDLLSGISLYLDSSSKISRVCGMVIGQYFSEKVKDEKRLDFELKESDSREFKPWMECLNEYKMEITDKEETCKTLSDKNEVVKPNISNVKSFKYLIETLALLKSGEDADPEKIELAIASLPSLIMTASDFEISQLAESIAEKVIYFTNEFEIKTFQDYKIKSMVCLLVRQPKTMPTYFAHQMYSRNTGMMQRMDILTSIGYACAELCGLKNIGESLTNFSRLVTIRGEIVPFTKSTPFSHVCLYFFNPLISEITKWYLYNISKPQVRT